MTDTERAALKAAAEKATPGPWTHVANLGQVGSVETADGDVLAQVQAITPRDHARRNTDAAYIASAHPAAVLALLDECERQKAENARLREALLFYSGHHAIPNDGPWGVASTDFGKVARRALSEPGA